MSHPKWLTSQHLCSPIYLNKMSLSHFTNSRRFSGCIDCSDVGHPDTTGGSGYRFWRSSIDIFSRSPGDRFVIFMAQPKQQEIKKIKSLIIYRGVLYIYTDMICIALHPCSANLSRYSSNLLAGKPLRATYP